MSASTPDHVPKLFRRLLRGAFHSADREFAIADLDAEFQELVERDGLREARSWYRAQVVRSMGPALRGRFIRRAHKTTGDVAAARPLQHRQSLSRMGEGLSAALSDLRFASRAFRKTPLVMAAIVVSLGFSIGAVSAAFALLNEVVFRPPVGLTHPSALVTVYESEDDGRRYGTVSYSDYEDVVRDMGSLQDAALVSIRNVKMDAAFGSRGLLTEEVTGNYFEVTGIAAVAGRVFTSSETSPRSPAPVAVISHALWVESFDGSPDALGAPIRLGGLPFTIIGVAPKGVASRRIPLEPDLWIPLGSIDAPGNAPVRLTARVNRNFLLLGRLRDGVTATQAQAEADVLATRLHGEYGPAWEADNGQPRTFVVVNEADSRIKPDARVLLLSVGTFFIAAAAMILLIACTNVASLFLARARRRTGELAVRMAMGASRPRLIRMLLTEGLLPGLASGVLGFSVAALVTRLIKGMTLPVAYPVTVRAELSPRVMVFTFAVSMLAALAFSVLPALKASKTPLLPALKNGTGFASGGRRRFFSWRNGLVLVQCAAAVVLLVEASLFLRTLDAATRLDLGFEPAGIAVASKQVDTNRMQTADGLEYLASLRQRLAAEPGVRRVEMARSLELTLFLNEPVVEVSVAGREPTPESARAFRNSVSPGYLEMLRVPLLRGRGLLPSDNADSRAVAVINETFAERYWPGEDPLGRVFSMGPTESQREIQVVGLAREGKYLDFDDRSIAYFWTSLSQDYSSRVAVAIQADDVDLALGALRRGIDLDEGELQLIPPSLFEDQVSIQFIHLRVASKVLGWGGLFGLFLAAIGIYGLVSFSVMQRARETAIRLSLGAKQSQVIRSLALEGVGLAGVGLLLGLLVAVPVATLMRGILWGVSPADPLALSVGVLALATVAGAASIIPARRVARVDPMGTLREE